MINENVKKALDAVQLALDVAGIEQTIGTAADAANTIISLLRAAGDKEKDQRKKHLIDAGISAVSMIPFADVVKLAKLRKLRKPITKVARSIKTGAKEMPKSYTETISKRDLKILVKETIREILSQDLKTDDDNVPDEMEEGFGQVYTKDIKKDPKHIEDHGKLERWRIKFQSANDLKKHGDQLGGKKI